MSPSKSPSENLSLLHAELRAFLPADRLLSDALSLAAHAGDASFYKLTPQLVARVGGEEEASALLAACYRHRVPVTFRAAGTSLSGQGVTDSILMPVARSFSRAQVLDGGSRIRLQPAVIGAAANRILAPYGRKLGPDPASLDAAMIGGIAANNASGMCCGTTANCYRTLDSLRVVLADGSVLDTSDPASRREFASRHAGLLEGLSGLAAEVQADAPLRDLIARKYGMKNTTGYGLNSLVDYQDPFDILQHLMIGSEGTLGFISEITLRTVPDFPRKAAILAFFADAASLGAALTGLAVAPVEAVEYMDEASLRSVASHPEIAASGGLEGRSALLIEIRGRHDGELRAHIDLVRQVLRFHEAPTLAIVAMDTALYHKIWSIRKGLFPAIGALRPAGTTIIIEDVAFPVSRLVAALADLRGLLDAHGYLESIIYGHALAGNLHFVFWHDFGRPSEVGRYAEFMDALAALVIGKYQGSLKAEHGTGRNMAPFVEREWGSQAYEIMRRIKDLFDPLGILNPDVLMSADERIHLKHLKPSPRTHPVVDQCIECGFCEPICPSRNLTLTPRQRIAVRREMATLQAGVGKGSRVDSIRLNALRQGFKYAGEQTCATDGLCATKCPVGIDTGTLIKSLRGESRPVWKTALAGFAARHFCLLTRSVRIGLRAYHGIPGLPLLLRILGTLLPRAIPPGLKYLPRAAKPASIPLSTSGPAGRVLYFPSCVNRVFGPHRPDDPPLNSVIIELLQRAGFEVRLIPGLEGLCCGLAFASKGFAHAADAKLNGIQEALDASGWGEVDLICDAAPCTQRLVQSLSGSRRIYDASNFLAERVLPRVPITARKGTIALHLPCSLVRMQTDGALTVLAEACAERVIRPSGMDCCGVAGDRIFTHPELPLTACEPLGDGLPAGCRDGYSASRTCEIGLGAAAGISYRSIAYLLHESIFVQVPEGSPRNSSPPRGSGHRGLGSQPPNPAKGKP